MLHPTIPFPVYLATLSVSTLYSVDVRWMTTNMKHWRNDDRGQSESGEKSLSQYHFIHHKPHSARTQASAVRSQRPNPELWHFNPADTFKTQRLNSESYRFSQRCGWGYNARSRGNRFLTSRDNVVVTSSRVDMFKKKPIDIFTTQYFYLNGWFN
jgi:hypothetical protein